MAVGALVGMVPVGRAQPLPAATPGSVRALARREPPPPWAPPPRVESELCQICLFPPLFSFFRFMDIVKFVYEVNFDCLRLQLTRFLLFAFLVRSALMHCIGVYVPSHL